MQRKVVQYAHLEAARRSGGAHAVAQRWQDRPTQRAACVLMGLAISTLAVYNAVLWLIR